MLLGFFVVFFSVVWVRIDEIFTTIIVHDSFLVYEAEVSKSIKMPLSSRFFIILYSSSDLRISVCIKPIEVVFEIEMTFLQIQADSIKTLGVSFVSRFHEVFKCFSHILGKPFSLLVKNS